MDQAIQRDTTEAAISARLKRCGMSLVREGDHYRLLYGDKALLCTNADGQPLSLADVDRLSRRFI